LVEVEIGRFLMEDPLMVAEVIAVAEVEHSHKDGGNPFHYSFTREPRSLPTIAPLSFLFLFPPANMFAQHTETEQLQIT